MLVILLFCLGTNNVSVTQIEPIGQANGWTVEQPIGLKKDSMIVDLALEPTDKRTSGRYKGQSD